MKDLLELLVSVSSFDKETFRQPMNDQVGTLLGKSGLYGTLAIDIFNVESCMDTGAIPRCHEPKPVGVTVEDDLCFPRTRAYNGVIFNANGGSTLDHTVSVPVNVLISHEKKVVVS